MNTGLKKASAIDKALTVFLLAFIVVMAYAYFVVPAPERWRFFNQALRTWLGRFA